VPAQREASFWGGDSVKERDVVLVQAAQIFQVDQNDPTQAAQIAGYATKMTAPQFWANIPPNRSVNPQGM
jgi:hypothetical protein